MDILEALTGVILLLLGLLLFLYIPSQIEKMYDVSPLPAQTALSIVYFTSTPGDMEINLSSKLQPYTEFRIRLLGKFDELSKRLTDVFENKGSYVAYGECIEENILEKIGIAAFSAFIYTSDVIHASGSLTKYAIYEGIGAGIMEVGADVLSERAFFTNFARNIGKNIGRYIKTAVGTVASAFIRYVISKLIVAATGGIGLVIVFAINFVAELWETIEIALNPVATCVDLDNDWKTLHKFYPIEEVYVSYNEYFETKIEFVQPTEARDGIYKQGIPNETNVLKLSIIKKEENPGIGNFGNIDIKANLSKQ